MIITKLRASIFRKSVIRCSLSGSFYLALNSIVDRFGGLKYYHNGKPIEKLDRTETDKLRNKLCDSGMMCIAYIGGGIVYVGDYTQLREDICPDIGTYAVYESSYTKHEEYHLSPKNFQQYMSARGYKISEKSAVKQTIDYLSSKRKTQIKQIDKELKEIDKIFDELI